MVFSNWEVRFSTLGKTTSRKNKPSSFYSEKGTWIINYPGLSAKLSSWGQRRVFFWGCRPKVCEFCLLLYVFLTVSNFSSTTIACEAVFEILSIKVFLKKVLRVFFLNYDNWLTIICNVVLEHYVSTSYVGTGRMHWL